MRIPTLQALSLSQSRYLVSLEAPKTAVLLKAKVPPKSAVPPKALAPHVADIAKCHQILADIACRCDTEEAPTYPIYVNYSRQVQVSPNARVSYPTIEFLCLNSNNNPTCREFPDMSSNVVSFRHSSRHDIFLCLRHD